MYRIPGNVCGRFNVVFHFMNENVYFNINLDIGNMVQVVNEYTLIIVKNVIFDTPSLLSASKNTSLFESTDDNFRLLRVLRCLGGAVLSSILPYASTIICRVAGVGCL